MAEAPVVEANTPVLVGLAAVQQKAAPGEGLEPLALMEQALRQAAADAHCPALLQRIDEIQVPKGIWEYSDPARLLAQRVGAGGARSLLAEIGVLQQTLMSRACRQIAAGEAGVVAVTGAEARYRYVQAQKAGIELPATVQEDVAADTVLLPEAEIWSEVESAAGLGMPVGYYAIIDSALRYRQGLDIDAHRDQMAAMYAEFSRVAAQNPAAWADEAVAAEFIREHSPGNRMLAFPYTKLHNSQWTVDQGAALIFCSAGIAEDLGVPRQQWVFPRAATESNHMTVVASRGDLGGSVGFRVAGAAASEMAGVNFDEIRLRELYSCFPAAVRAQLDAFGMRDRSGLTVTGGMTFGGGPLNNFVLQATVRMAELLRQQPAEVGLVTSVSGMLTKQACALWSCQPNPDGFRFADVSEETRARAEVRDVVADYCGEAVVAGFTVLYQGDTPWRAVAVLDIPDGRRTVAYSEQPGLLAQMMAREYCGEAVTVQAGQFSAVSSSGC